MHLETIIPNPDNRKPIYRIFALLGLLIGAVQVGYSVVPDVEQPVWLSVVLAVYAFLGGAGFTLANAHTGTLKDPYQGVDIGDSSEDGYFEFDDYDDGDIDDVVDDDGFIEPSAR